MKEPQKNEIKMMSVADHSNKRKVDFLIKQPPLLLSVILAVQETSKQ